MSVFRIFCHIVYKLHIRVDACFRMSNLLNIRLEVDMAYIRRFVCTVMVRDK